MMLELNQLEAELLKKILVEDLEEARVEEHHAKNIGFKADVQSRGKLAQGLIDRLESLAG